jgi:uncharacterized membrane protein
VIDRATPEAIAANSGAPVPCHGTRRVLCLLLAAIYVAFGFVHVAVADAFLPIMPDWVPWPRGTVIATGLCEIAGGVGLLHPRTRRLAGIMLAIYAVCVYPANIKHAVENVAIPVLPRSWWYHGPRLAFQPVFVWWALFGAGVMDWPCRRRTLDQSGRTATMSNVTGSTMTISPGTTKKR